MMRDQCAAPLGAVSSLGVSPEVRSRQGGRIRANFSSEQEARNGAHERKDSTDSVGKGTAEGCLDRIAGEGNHSKFLEAVAEAIE
jgi:hypothetical protein